MKGSFMLIPNDIEQTVGFDHGKHSSITEDAHFAFCNWDKIRFCRGYLEEQSPFTIRDTIKQRRRWATGLWLLVFHHPVAFWKKSFMICQMIAWVLSPLVAVSFVCSFIFYEYKMPVALGVCLGFNFGMFNLMYIWGSFHNIYRNHWSRIIHTILTPFLLPFFMIMEGIAGVLGTFFPVTGFPLVEKQSDALSQRSAASTLSSLSTISGVNANTYPYPSYQDLPALAEIVEEV